MFEEFKIIKQLKQLRNSHKDGEFIKELRSDLCDYIAMDVEEEEQIEHHGFWGRSGFADRFHSMSDKFDLTSKWAKAGVFSLIIVFLGSGVAMASQESLPGDALYPVKLLTEDVRFTFAGSNESKAKLHISFAAERISEIKTILQKKGANAEGLDVARARLQHNASIAKEILDREEKEGRNVSELAKEINHEFSDQKRDLQESYQSKEDSLKSEERDIKEKIRSARKEEDGAKLEALNNDLDAIKDEKSDLVSRRNEMIRAIQESKKEVKQKMQESERIEEDKKDLAEEINKVLQEKKMLLEKMVQEKVDLNNEEAFDKFDQLVLEAQKTLQGDGYDQAQQFIKQAREELSVVENKIDNISPEDAYSEELKDGENSGDGSGPEGEIRKENETATDRETDKKEDDKKGESQAGTMTRLG